MDTGNVYATCLGAFFALFIGRQIAAETSPLRHKATSVLRKYVGQMLVFTRPNGSGDISVGTAAGILVLIALNAAACAFQVASQSQLGSRLGKVAVINLVPLLLGGRTSLIANSVLGLPLSHYETLHRWIGRLCAFEALGHLLIGLSQKGWQFSAINIVLLCTISTLLVTSFYLLRRAFYEVFLKTHEALALLLVLALWRHVGLRNGSSTICLAVASGLWALQFLSWTLLFAYRNVGGRHTIQSRVIHFQSEGASIEAMLLEVNVRRPWRVRHGQYVYITVPSIPGSLFCCIQSHPYLIAWTRDDTNNMCETLTLLIEARDGFSNRLRLCKDTLRVLVNGPYGMSSSLEDYDKVLFVANGIGIAAHLLAIRQLLEGHNDRSARVRRISLIWFVDRHDQESWAKPFLELLSDMDRRRIFSVLINRADHQQVPSQTSNSQERPRWFYIDGSLDMRWFIEKEWDAEAGNMVVSLCGSPKFERYVRNALRSTPHDLHLVTSSFKMDGRQGVERNFGHGNMNAKAVSDF